MTYELTPYVIPCAVAACIAFVVSFLAWNKRTMPGGLALSLLMCGVVIWCGGVAFEYAAVGIPAKVLWSKIEYIGIVTSPVLFMIFTMQYNRYNRLLTRRNVAFLFLIPLITYLLALTNEWHGLIWNSFTPSLLQDNLLIYGHGPGFWIGVIGYSYVMMIVGTGLLVWSLFRYPSSYRYQTLLMVVATSLPWLGNIVYITGLSPVPGLELTPIFMAFTGGIFTWNLFYLQLLDLVPVARDLLIETMPDGMLVLDSQNRVADYNSAAQLLMGEQTMVNMGKEISQLFSDETTRNEFLFRLSQCSNQKFDFSMMNMQNGYLEFSVSPIHIPHRSFTGRLVVIRDITQRTIAEQKIRQTNELLRSQLEEIESLQSSLREQAVRDSLTGLFNRRYLDETLEREFARALRDQSPLSICMLDIDHFKEFNDTNGHIAGDVVLQHLGNILSSNTRLGDIVCRYGGEEFVVVIPDMQAEMAHQRIEYLRREFETTPVVFDGKSYSATFSGGVAAYPEHGDEVNNVVAAADQALYTAKSNGRNCIIVA